MFFNSRKNVYDAGDGPIRYLDGSSLSRPFDMQRPQLVIMGVFVVAAIFIGGFLLFDTLDKVSHSAERAQASVEQNLARPSSITNLPLLSSLVSLDDETIQSTFAEAQYTVLNMTKTDGDEAGVLDLIKLPADVSTEQAALMYAQGIPSLSAADAALLLNGSWRFSADRRDFTDMRVKYADFSSGSVDAAIQAAMLAEGFDPATVTDAGVDDAGNSYQAGTLLVGETTCNWRVSAIPLSVIYKVQGLPETAVYVGVRLYPQA